MLNKYRFFIYENDANQHHNWMKKRLTFWIIFGRIPHSLSIKFSIGYIKCYCKYNVMILWFMQRKTALARNRFSVDYPIIRIWDIGNFFRTLTKNQTQRPRNSKTETKIISQIQIICVCENRYLNVILYINQIFSKHEKKENSQVFNI